MTILVAFVAAGYGSAAEPVHDRSAAGKVILGSKVIRSERAGGWLIQETVNFRILTSPDESAAKFLPANCEALRSQLQETWLSKAGDQWSPKCDIVVHSSLAGYVQALGPESGQSSGCATIDTEPGRVLKRRIDLRGDARDCFDSALPHELTHVVVAERFTHRRIPRWADEGMAILAEPSAKQKQRRDAFQRSLAAARPYTAKELAALVDYPAAGRVDLFYGQSASLVSYLIERESPARFLEFVERSTATTFETAAAEVFGAKDWREMEATWRTLMLVPGESAELLASRVSRIAAMSNLD